MESQNNKDGLICQDVLMKIVTCVEYDVEFTTMIKLHVFDTHNQGPYSIDEFAPDHFSKASTAWRNNKISAGSMRFYKCCYIHKSTNKRCRHPIHPPRKLDCGFLEDTDKHKNTSDTLCYQHRRRTGIYAWI